MTVHFKLVGASLLLCGLLAFVKAEDSSYDNKYDNVDLDEILQSERLLTNYIKCLVERGPCTPDGKQLKDTLPDAINSDCEKCTEKQKNGSEKVMHYIIDNRPEEWEELEKMYDPSGTYRMKYLASKQSNSSSEDDKEN